MVNSEWAIRTKKPVNGGLNRVNFFGNYVIKALSTYIPIFLLNENRSDYNGIILLLYNERFVYRYCRQGLFLKPLKIET